MQRKKRKKRVWSKGDVLRPRINKSPKRDIEVTILEVRKDGYFIGTKGSKIREEIEFKYLEDSYISEKGLRVYTWVLVTKGEMDGQEKDTHSNKRSRGQKRRKTASNDNVQKVCDNGPVRKRSKRAPGSSSKHKKGRKQS